MGEIHDGEILVGCSTGTFQAQKGHSVSGAIRSALLRSLDGGETWTANEPDGYLNDPGPLADLAEPIDFTAPVPPEMLLSWAP